MKQNYEFIKVNNSILDYSEYLRSTILLKNYLKHRLLELLLEEGFGMEVEKNESYDVLHAVFYNKEKDLQITIGLKKKSPEEWV